jgi:Holliday junction resolvase RusA-like endonuclease
VPVNTITLRIDGPPRGKGRPRFSRASGRAYTDHQTQTAEQRVQGAWVHAGRPRIDGPLAMTVEVVLERPGSHRKRNGELSAAGKRSPHPTRRPDFDNVAKLIADSLNRCAYSDDAAIVDCRIVKRWGERGEYEHTLVTLRALVADEAVAA